MKNTIFKKLVSLSVLITTLTVSITLPLTNIAQAAESSSTTINSESDTTSTDSTVESLWPDAPDTTSGNVILIDADTGAILYEKNAYEKCYPASTTKILTGLLAIENCNMDEIVTFSSEAANSVSWEDANLGTKTGEQYTVEQALYGLLLYSANEIAYGLAEHVAGSLDAFVDMMNERAVEAGAKNTHFANASGLYDEDHYTTPYDMAMIARACYNNATFVSIDSTYTTYTIPATNMTSTERTFQHRHLMLKNRTYYYEYCKGGKTGFTDQSQYTLVTFAEKDDMRLIAVCMNADEDGRYVDTKAVFDWGFDNFQKVITTNDTLTSTLSNNNYYYSSVFSKSNLFFDLDVSSLTIPNDASVGSVTVQADEDSESTDSDGTFTTDLQFVYDNHIVGTADLVVSSQSNATKSSQLPFIEESSSDTTAEPKKCFVINVWVIGGIVIALIIGYYVYMDMQRTKRRTRHYTRRHHL